MNSCNYPYPLGDHYIDRMREVYRARSKRIAAVKTAEDVDRYRKRVRRVLKAAFGKMPRKTDLKTRVWRGTEWADHRIEHLTFESRPGMLVTANLYLPLKANGPLPGVLLPCGHYGDAKAAEPYHAACVRLVRAGYAVLIYDPIAQGERPMYSHNDAKERIVCCDAHNVLGRQLHLSGEWFGAWRLWDGIRATDVLAARPEVDETRLAVTGQSGGGLLSAYLWAMEPRFKAVASSSWCTSMLNDLENGLPQDDEQVPPGFLAAGCDKVDFFTVRAGEPVLLLGQQQDFFDNRGLEKGFAELAQLHAAVGGDPELCQLTMEDNAGHSFTDKGHADMIAFFNRVFGKGVPAPIGPVEPRKVKELWVTPEGDVWKAGSKPMPEVAAEISRRVAAKRKPTTAEDLPGLIRATLGIPEAIPVPHYRRLFHMADFNEKLQRIFMRFLVEAEPRLCLELEHCVKHPACCSGNRLNPEPHCVIYLSDTWANEELQEPGFMDTYNPFWCLDVRGLGNQMVRADDPQKIYGHDYMTASCGVLFNQSLLGDRVRDVLMTLELLKSDGAKSFRLIGRRQGAILALLAAVLEPAVETVECLDAPESFLALATAPYTVWPAVNFPRNVLKAFDLPELRTALGSRLVKDSHSDPVEFPALSGNEGKTV